jgi:phage-related protein
MNYKFKVVFLEPVLEFLENLDQKAKEKVLYNIWKSRSVNDKALFKKLDGEIWEFRTLYNKQYLRLFAFWDKSDKEDTIVISTHGIVKKTDKTPKSEIERAESLRVKYFSEKKEEDENI